MATVTYNGIAITKCKISRFVTENEFEGENRNRTSKRHTIDGVGIVQYTNFSTGVGSVRNALNAPGQLLKIQFEDNATELLLATGASDTTAGRESIRDTGKGPLPSVNITEIAGGYAGTLIVGFSFVWNNCNSSPIQRAEITITHSIDEEGISTIDRRGVIQISASNTQAGGPGSTPVSPQTAPTVSKPYPNITDLNMSTGSPAVYSASPSDYRYLVAGMIPIGFKRTKQEYYVQPDQRTLAFHITDTQTAATLPAPAISGDASFEYERGIEGDDVGKAGRKTFRCNLVGPPIDAEDLWPTNGAATDYKTLRASLLFRALEIALTRIRFMPPTPDTIMSFKVSEPSLFKRNEVSIEIVAMGVPLNTSQFNVSGSTDQWLYQYLFTDPNAGRIAPLHSQPYGFSVFGSGYAPKFQFDPCTLSNSWVELTGTTQGISVSPKAPSGDQTSQPVDPNNNGSGDVAKPAVDGQQPDQQLIDDAPGILSYRASQSVDISSRMTQLETMGGDSQFSFQTSLPKVYVTQTVEMVTRVKGMSVPWPVVDDPYVVTAQTMQMNDGSSDAAGNRTIAIRATRTIQVSVANSANLRRYTGSGEIGNSARAVWMPDAMKLPRNAYSGSIEVTMKENLNGTIVRQDVVDPSTSGTSA